LPAASAKGKIQWFETKGVELFDVLSNSRTNLMTFDAEFYHDQKCTRKKKIAKHMSSEYVDKKINKEKTASRQKRRCELARGFDSSLQAQDVEMEIMSEDEFADVDLEEFMAVSVTPSTSEPEIADRRTTRSSSILTPSLSLISQSTQTDLLDIREISFPQLSTRIPSSVKEKKGHFIQPCIIEAAVVAETVGHCSMQSAIKVIEIVANRIFKQSWSLPRSLDEEYLKDMKMLKKFEADTGQDLTQTEEICEQGNIEELEVEFAMSVLPD
jgi:hypothetical protein